MLEATYNLLSDWMKQDNDILKIEYDGLVIENESKSQTEKKVIDETTKLGWENKKLLKDDKIRIMTNGKLTTREVQKIGRW